MEEIWKKLEDECFQNRYEISNLGRIKRLEHKYLVWGMHEKISPEKILNPQINNCGYKYVYITYNNKMYGFSIHKLVAKSFIPNPDNLPEIDHIDGDKNNNRVDNLRWCTHKENMQNHFTSNRYDHDYHVKMASAGCAAKMLVEQKPKLITKSGFLYNGKWYDKISDIYEEHINSFKNYRQCWGIVTQDGKIKKQRRDYLTLI